MRLILSSNHSFNHKNQSFHTRSQSSNLFTEYIVLLLNTLCLLLEISVSVVFMRQLVFYKDNEKVIRLWKTLIKKDQILNVAKYVMQMIDLFCFQRI